MVHWCVKHPRHITSSIDPSSDSKNGPDLQRATDRTQNNNYIVISYNLEQSCTPPPPPALYSPKIKDVKMARFGFCAASPRVLDLGGMGVCCSILNSPKIKDAKMARFGFYAASSWVLDLGGMGLCCSILFCPRL